MRNTTRLVHINYMLYFILLYAAKGQRNALSAMQFTLILNHIFKNYYSRCFYRQVFIQLCESRIDRDVPEIIWILENQVLRQVFFSFVLVKTFVSLLAILNIWVILLINILPLYTEHQP